MTRQRENTYPEPEIVDRPIELPRRMGGGYFSQLIEKQVMKLKPTTRERGLAPHIKFTFDKREKCVAFYNAFGSAMRRFKRAGEGARVADVRCTMFNDAEQNVVYVWREQGKRKRS